MKKKCLVKSCERKAYCRGLCRSCYQTALKAVSNGKTTWEELEAMGLSLPPKNVVSATQRNPFRVAFEELLAQPESPAAPDPRAIKQELDGEFEPPTMGPGQQRTATIMDETDAAFPTTGEIGILPEVRPGQYPVPPAPLVMGPGQQQAPPAQPPAIGLTNLPPAEPLNVAVEPQQAEPEQPVVPPWQQ